MVVAMGSGCGVLEQAVGKINRDGGKVGLVKVREQTRGGRGGAACRGRALAPLVLL